MRTTHRGATVILPVRTVAACAAILCLMLSTTAIGAQEIDVDIGSEVGARYEDDTTLFTETTADGSLTWILSPDADIELSGGYAYRYDEATVAADGEEDGELTPSLDRARYFGRSPIGDSGTSVFELRAGRFGFADTTGLVVDTPADGLSIGIVSPVVTARLQGAYTGLLFRDSTGVRVTGADLRDFDNLLGPAHLLGRFELAFPELLERQSIILDAVVQRDMPELPSSDIENDDRQDGAYASLTLTGPLSRRVFYTAYGIGHYARYYADADSSSETYDLLGTAAGGSIRAFAPELGKSRAELTVTYASGEPGYTRYSPTASGTATFFSGITGADLTRFAPVEFANVVVGRLDYSVQPVDRGAGPREGLRTAVSVAGAYRPVRGDGTVSGLRSDAETGYVGTEIGATIEFRPFSDLRFAVESDMFIPSDLLRNAGRFEDTDPRGQITARVELSL